MKINHIFTSKASDGANELKKVMDLKRIKLEGSKFKGSQSKTVINWGSVDLLKKFLILEFSIDQRISNQLRTN